jgi:hypothetical protein
MSPSPWNTGPAAFSADTRPGIALLISAMNPLVSESMGTSRAENAWLSWGRSASAAAPIRPRAPANHGAVTAAVCRAASSQAFIASCAAWSTCWLACTATAAIPPNSTPAPASAAGAPAISAPPTAAAISGLLRMIPLRIPCASIDPPSSPVFAEAALTLASVSTRNRSI